MYSFEVTLAQYLKKSDILGLKFSRTFKFQEINVCKFHNPSVRWLGYYLALYHRLIFWAKFTPINLIIFGGEIK